MSNINANQQVGEYQLGSNQIIDSLWLKFSNNKEGTWILKIKEAVALHHYLKELQPKHILELGSGIGCASEIMAFTCPNTSIYAVEQSQKCIDVAKKLINEKALERIYFRKVEVKITRPIFEVNPLQFWMVYDDYDWKDYDFILVDGPSPIMTEQLDKKTGEVWKFCAELPGADLIFLLPRMKEGTLMYVDHRKLMVNLYIRHLGIYLEMVENTKERAIFRRTAEPLQLDLKDFKNKDLTLINLTKYGYFEEK